MLRDFSGFRVENTIPTGPFRILEPQDQEIGKFNEAQERPMTEFEAPYKGKGWSSNVLDRIGHYSTQLCLNISTGS